MNNKIMIHIIAILSLSFLITSYLSISPALPLIEKGVTKSSAVNTELLVTIPALFMAIMVFASSFISRKIGIKNMTIVGLGIVLCSSLLSARITSMDILLRMRGVLGVGLGMVNFSAIELININYCGDEKAYVMGVRSAVESLGQSILAIGAGKIIRFGWNKVFLIYLAGIPILILFIKAFTNQKLKNYQKEQKIIYKISRKDVALTFLTLFLLIAHTGLIVRLSNIIIIRNLGSISDASMIQGAMTLIGMISGCCFGIIFKKVSHYLFPLSLFGMGIVHYLIYLSSNIFIVTIAMLLAGALFCILISYIFNMICEVSYDGAESFSSALILMGCNLGGFTAPFFLQFFTEVFGEKNNIVFPFQCFSICFIVLSIILFCIIMKINKKEESAKYSI